MNDFDQAIQEHIYLYKEGIQDKYYQGAKWAWNHRQAKIDELQKRVGEISSYATELAEYASYAEIVGAVSHNRQAIREFCDKIFAYNRAIDLEEEKAMRGEHE